MPKKQTAPPAPPPASYSSDDMATARGVTPATIHKYVYLAGRADPPWPARAIPRPDHSYPLRWNADREDVIAWITSAGDFEPGVQTRRRTTADS